MKPKDKSFAGMQAAVEVDLSTLTPYVPTHKKGELWNTFCTCTHSGTAHKTEGKGACMIQKCKCLEFV